jgi:hypothetical protein
MSNHKLTFDKAITDIEKEFGLDIETEEQKQKLEQFRNIPFFRWDLPVEEHYRMYKSGECNCFNCKIKWPRRGNIEYPLFDYQKMYLDTLQRDRLCYCLKARSCGISEVTLRWLEWMALKDTKLAGSQIIILSSPAEELSLSFMRRIRAHLQPLLGPFETREKTIILGGGAGGVRIQTTPSHNLLQLRGITNVSALIVEESSFWPKSEEEELLPIILPLIQKNPGIYMSLISTPGRIGSLMHKIHLTPQSQTPFHKVYIDYKQVVGKLWTHKEIDEAKKSNAAFEREYSLAFGVGMSNLYDAADLQYCIELGRAYATDKTVNPDLANRPYPNTIYQEGTPVIGVDPGAGDSRFAIVGLQLWNGKAHIFYAKSFSRPMEDDMVQLLLRLWKYGTQGRANIFCDFANVNFIRKLKAAIAALGYEEPVDITWHLDYIRKHGWAGRNDENIGQHMIVCPVSFGKYGADLLQKSATFVQRRWLAINPDAFPELIEQMQSVRTKDSANTDWALDKSTDSLDLIDAFRLCMYNMKVSAPYLKVGSV